MKNRYQLHISSILGRLSLVDFISWKWIIIPRVRIYADCPVTRVICSKIESHRLPFWDLRIRFGRSYIVTENVQGCSFRVVAEGGWWYSFVACGQAVKDPTWIKAHPCVLRRLVVLGTTVTYDNLQKFTTSSSRHTDFIGISSSYKHF